MEGLHAIRMQQSVVMHLDWGQSNRVQGCSRLGAMLLIGRLAARRTLHFAVQSAEALYTSPWHPTALPRADPERLAGDPGPASVLLKRVVMRCKKQYSMDNVLVVMGLFAVQSESV